MTVLADEKLEFAADVPFVRTMLSDTTAETFTQRAASLFADDKAPNARPQASKGDALINGYGNTWVKDRDMEYIHRNAFDKTLDDYLRKNPIILLQHNHAWPIGQVSDAGTDDTGLALEGYVRKPLDKDPDWKHGAYNDILAGILRTLSIGGYFYREIIEGEIIVMEVELFENSVVAVPSNPDSIFEATRKAALGMRGGNAVGQAMLTAKMAQLLGLQPITDPAIIERPEMARRTMYLELAAQFTRDTGVVPPEYQEWRNLSVQCEREGATIKGVTEEATRFLAAHGKTFGMRYVPKSVAFKTTVGDHTEDVTLDLHALAAGRGISFDPSEKAEGEVTIKAGRVLSKANEGKLRTATEKVHEAAAKIEEVLAALPEEGEAATPTALADLKGVFGQVYNAYELEDALWDGFWALRQAISKALGIYEQDASPDIAAVVEACNEFRDWLLDKAQQYGGDEAVRAAAREDMKVLTAALGTRTLKETTTTEPQPLELTVTI